MKRRLMPGLCMAAMLLLTVACHNDEKAIKKTAYKYSYAMANYKVDEAEQYATAETRETTLIKARIMIDRVGDSYIKLDTPATINIIAQAQTSDTTAYAVYHKTTPIKNFADTLQLRKRDGKWYAHATIAKVAPTPPQEGGIMDASELSNSRNLK